MRARPRQAATRKRPSAPATPRGFTRKAGHRPQRRVRLRNFFQQHLRAFFYSLGQITSMPLSSLMTAGAIGITLALPAGLYLALDNVNQLAGTWDRTAQVSLFLDTGVDNNRITSLMDMLRDNPAIGDVGHIAPDQALRGLQQDAGLGDALGALDENPLPHVLVVSPRLDLANDQLHGLVRELESLSGVELAQLDLEWLERLNAMLELGQRGVLALAGLLSLAVLLTIGNTIRLAIENRREEIEITKLVGASNAFVRRPFLYTGFWFGSLGGVVGWLILYGVFTFMEAPLARLLQLYGSGLQFHAMTLQTTAVYLTISMLLGLSGAWLAVGRHLRTIEPA